jgi:NAD(P)-dependent dehydrogenase (short-subunit alcohol dehydrogenase family)
MTEAGRLKGRRAVVTGGGRGIGASTAASENFTTINARIELFGTTAQLLPGPVCHHAAGLNRAPKRVRRQTHQISKFSLSRPIGHQVDIWNENWT